MPWGSPPTKASAVTDQARDGVAAVPVVWRPFLRIRTGSSSRLITAGDARAAMFCARILW